MGELFHMLKPKAVALIGATDRPGSFSEGLLKNLAANKKIKFFPVNKKRDYLLGFQCYKNILDIEEHIDLAVLAVPAQLVLSALEDCGRAKVDGAVIVSTGFGATGRDGLLPERDLLETGKKYDIRIIGPGSLGILHTHIGLNATPLSQEAVAGNIAFISHTGNFPRTLFDWGVSRNIGFSMVASLGSAIDVDFGSMIDFLGSDPYTKSIILYMEDKIGDAKRFISAARGYARNKPIVVLKPHLLEKKAEEVYTHTGMLSGADEALDAVFRRVGIVRVSEAQDLLDTATVLCSGNRPRGPNLAIITNAAGMGVMAANRLLSLGGKLAELSSATISKLDGLLPVYWRRENPVNVMHDASVERYIGTIGICLEDNAVDGILVIYTPQDKVKSAELAQAIVAIAHASGKPILTSWLGGQEVHPGRNFLVYQNIPAYETSEGAVQAYMYMYNYERSIMLINETPAELGADESPPVNHLKTLIKKICRLNKPVLADDEAVRFLSNYGIPTVKSRLAMSLEEALDCAEEIGYPVVLKISSPDIFFRHDVGGVAIGIGKPQELREEYGKIFERVKRNIPSGSVQGVVVQKMVEAIDYELILGARKDQNFGSVIMFGRGGVGVEVFRDFSVALPPLNQTLARRLIEETEVHKMLQGYRRKTPADFQQLEEILVSFSHLVIDFPEIREIDINPLAVVRGKTVALDAKIIMDKSCVYYSVPYPHLVISPYPSRYISNWRLKDGTDVLLRPIKPQDEPLEHEMLTTLSEETIRGRYYQTIKNITHMMHVKSCNIDYDREMAIVAEVRENSKRKIIGVVSYAVESNLKACEFAILVHDDYQGKGLAYKLLDYLIGIAEEKKLEEFFGYIEATNVKMQKLCEKMGMTKVALPDGLMKVSLMLN